MKFKITKTSVWDDEDKPVERAYLTKFPNYQVRTCNEEDFNKRFSDKEGLWRSKGTEHEVLDNGYISRRFEDVPGWAVDINSIDELIKFSNEHGQLIISNGKYASIEIYDDYRE